MAAKPCIICKLKCGIASQMKTKSKTTVTANVDLKISDEVVSLCATVPDRKVGAIELIPVY